MCFLKKIYPYMNPCTSNLCCLRVNCIFSSLSPHVFLLLFHNNICPIVILKKKKEGKKENTKISGGFRERYFFNNPNLPIKWYCPHSRGPSISKGCVLCSSDSKLSLMWYPPCSWRGEAFTQNTIWRWFLELGPLVVLILTPRCIFPSSNIHKSLVNCVS